MKKLELLYIAGGIVKWYRYFGKWLEVPQMLSTQKLFYDPEILLLHAQNNENIMFTQKLSLSNKVALFIISKK